MKSQLKNSSDRGIPLWRARRQAGLERKQVSHLIGHRTPDPLARYERGEIEPTLDNAIKLAVVYGVDLEALYPHKYETFRKEILPRIKAGYFAEPKAGQIISRLSKCSWEAALDDESAADFYSPYVRSHVTTLAKRLAGL